MRSNHISTITISEVIEIKWILFQKQKYAIDIETSLNVIR